ncbi:MAG: aminotransferase class V-fold PLP-dependent enzyme [Gemmatimonadota bacterium]|nr:aminotransferase class V-fold PLP-dependent enzyme [Gemmatimonadota bacterium]
MSNILEVFGGDDPNPQPLPCENTPDWRSHFPTLAQEVNGFPLAYLDTAATAQRPTMVTKAVVDFYDRDNANPGRTLHTLARRADDDYESSRRTAAAFINAADPLEIIFTRGTTEGINLVATAWGGANLRAGDEVLLTVSEHASNMLPWQLAAKRAGATVRYLDIDDDGHLRLDQLDSLFTPRTRVFAFMHVSNVLGLINPARELCARSRRAGVITVVDAAQSVPHLRVDVQDMGCDFLAFSGHKMMGPMGTGVLWGRRALLDAMPAYQAGSNMAHEINLHSADYSPGALKFGAGTPNVSGAVGLAAAMRFIDSIGYDALREHEQTLTRYALSRLGELPGVRILGSTRTAERIGVLSFVMDGVQPQEVVSGVDAKGIAIRGGDLASLPLLMRLGVTRAARASIYLYTTVEEIDRLVDAVIGIRCLSTHQAQGANSQIPSADQAMPARSADPSHCS